MSYSAGSTEFLDGDQLRRARVALCVALRRRHLDHGLIDRCVDNALGEALLELTQVVARGGPVPDPVAWVVKVGIWRAIDHLRRETRRHEVPYDTDEAPCDPTGKRREALVAPGTGRVLDDIEADRLRSAIRALPREQREVLFLHYFVGLSSRQRARALGYSASTFSRRLRAAIDSLAARRER